MFGLSGSEILFYGGLAVMGAAASLGAAAFVAFHITGRRLRKKLEQEYGKPKR